MNAIARALAHGPATATQEMSDVAKTREGTTPHHTTPELSWATFASWRWVTYRARLQRDDAAARNGVSGPRRCETCGVFVPKRHLKTARYSYDLDRTLPVYVYSLATATVFRERLVCAGCSMDCGRMFQAQRGYGIAVGKGLPNGWIECTLDSTQANVIERVKP